ncbi:MAG: hypothetical protein Q7S13_00665 [Candidatus Omnitrophota bacterium]|nr:hypothetical protein [Candidatus Omnitrophota bacterium]
MLRLLNKRRKKGQSTLEYAILIIIILGALMSIQIYIKRGIQGRLKSATDDIGDQFSPGNTNVVKTMHTVSNSVDTFVFGKSKSTLTGKGEITTEQMNSDIMIVNQEFWQ